MKKNTKNEELRTTSNQVLLSGEVAKIVYQTKKAVKFNICTYAVSRNGKQVRRYVPVVAFGDFGLEEGDSVRLAGWISTDKSEYNNKTYYDTVVHTDNIEECDFSANN